jgi:hypothetical protein
VFHFVGTGFGRPVDAYEADLDFLHRVAIKIARMEEDLGKVNAVLADAVQRRMLGEPVDVDDDPASAGDAGIAPVALPADTDVREQVRRLRANIDDTIRELGISPPAVNRVVDTALELARQQPLRPYAGDTGRLEGWYAVPPLTGSWQRATEGLTERLVRDGEPPRQLPVTFDPALARDRDDVVLAHLGHPLVAMSTRLLRAAVSGGDIGLHRVAAVVSDDPAVTEVLVGAYARFVLVGADGVRLHEEVLHAGGWAPAGGRFRRLENLTVLGGILDRALASGRPASDVVQVRLAARWEGVRGGLLAAIDWRTRTRQEALDRKLTQRRDAERARVVANFDQFAATLRAALAADGDEDALISRIDVEKSRDELAQYRRDREAWSRRLADLDAERERELATIAARYADPRPHRFPVAVVFVVPRHDATR